VHFKSFVAPFITYTSWTVLVYPALYFVITTPLPSVNENTLNSFIFLATMAQTTDIATRALIMTLKSPLIGMKTVDVAEKVGYSVR